MWFPFALLFALITSVNAVIAKRIMRDTGEYLYLFVSTLFTIPFLFLVVLLFYEIPSFDQVFLAAVAGSVLLDVVAAVAAYKAIKITEISLISPISAFNPVFTAIVSFFTLGEVIGARGVLGILLICVGAYILQLSRVRRGFLEPIKSLLGNKGVQLSFLAYFIWAVTPTLQKTAILHTTPQNPPFASLAGMIGVELALVPLVFKLSREPVSSAKPYLKLFVLLGILTAVASTSAFISFSLTKLGLVTAIFKLSMLFTVILGWVFFKERNIKDRLAGSVIMLTGVVLLVV